MLVLSRRMRPLLLLVMISACSGHQTTSAETFEQALTDAASSGQAVQLVALAPFTWDRVLVFRDYWRGSDLNAVAGLQVMNDGDHLDENLAMWVFVDGDQLARTYTTGYTWILVDLPDESRCLASAGEPRLGPDDPLRQGRVGELGLRVVGRRSRDKASLRVTSRVRPGSYDAANRVTGSAGSGFRGSWPTCFSTWPGNLRDRPSATPRVRI